MRSPNIWAALALAALGSFGCATASSRPASPVPARTSNLSSARHAPTAIGGGPASVPASLDSASAERFVEGRTEVLRNDCYAPDAGVTSFLVDVSIAPDGHVEGTEIPSVSGDGNVAACVRERIEKMTFPRAAEGSTHTFTFLFGR